MRCISPDLRERQESRLEPTFSREQICEAFGFGHTTFFALCKTGRMFKGKRGGFYPTFLVTHKTRRVPASAILRHFKYMARTRGEPEPDELVLLPLFKPGGSAGAVESAPQSIEFFHA